MFFKERSILVLVLCEQYEYVCECILSVLHALRVGSVTMLVILVQLYLQIRV